MCKLSRPLFCEHSPMEFGIIPDTIERIFATQSRNIDSPNINIHGFQRIRVSDLVIGKCDTVGIFQSMLVIADELIMESIARFQMERKVIIANSELCEKPNDSHAKATMIVTLAVLHDLRRRIEKNVYDLGIHARFIHALISDYQQLIFCEMSKILMLATNMLRHSVDMLEISLASITSASFMYNKAEFKRFVPEDIFHEEIEDLYQRYRCDSDIYDIDTYKSIVGVRINVELKRARNIMNKIFGDLSPNILTRKLLTKIFVGDVFLANIAEQCQTVSSEEDIWNALKDLSPDVIVSHIRYFDATIAYIN